MARGHGPRKGANPLPLLLVHGWPWTFMDFHALIGLLTSIPYFPGLDLDTLTPDRYAPDEQWMVARRAESAQAIVSHFTVQSNEPQTLAYALVDSPVGTAAWLWTRRRLWSDCGGDVLTAFDRDFLCTLASLYWLTRTIGTSMRIYWEHARHGGLPLQPLHERTPAIEVPTGFAEQPELMTHELRSFFRPLRKAGRCNDSPSGH